MQGQDCNEREMITVKALPAYDGDCLIVQYGEEDQRTNLFVDGGQGQQVVRQLKEEIATISQKGECIDLLILTHIDADHIRGFLSLFSQSSFDKSCIKRVFFNSRKLLSQKFDTKVVYDDQLEIVQEKAEISFKQGESFDRYLEDLKIEKMTVIDNSCQPKLLNGAKMTILTPDEASLRKLYTDWEKAIQKETRDQLISGRNVNNQGSVEELIKKAFQEDRAVANGSSISFILEYEGKRLLMLADAHPSTVTAKLKELYGEKELHFDLVKVAHHGSKANTSDDLLKQIECENYLISSNKGNRHGFPHKEALSRIVYHNYTKKRPTNFYFNYSDASEGLFTNEEIKKYGIQLIKKKMNERVLTIDI
ncbi:hypothetical protein IGJ32_000523 [Enterococcus sp. DIV1639a]|uniref:ComEC/Rec2 family competence protein n=3 Tax=Enterococcus TaxID=1350 RepID=UPI00313CBD60